MKLLFLFSVALVLGGLCGCVTQESQARWDAHDARMDALEAKLAGAATAEEADAIRGEIDVERARGEEIEKSLEAERVESVKGFSGKAGTIVDLLAGIAPMVGIPWLSSVLGLIGGGLRTVAGRVAA